MSTQFHSGNVGAGGQGRRGEEVEGVNGQRQMAEPKTDKCVKQGYPSYKEGESRDDTKTVPTQQNNSLKYLKVKACLSSIAFHCVDKER